MMAEEIVSEVILKLSGVITRKIVDEVRLQRGVSRELKHIMDELQMITAFLEDAEDKAERNGLVKVWLGQVRNIGYRIEDVVDEHVILVCLGRLHNQTWNQCLRLSLIIPFKIAQCVKELKLRHEIGNSIADIKAQISDIQQRKMLYDLQTRDQVEPNIDTSADARIWQDPRVGFLYSKDSDLVGIEQPQREIFELLDLEMKDSRCSITSIVGLGGIGKTTLAWKVYDNQEVKRQFYVRAWVNVTQSYSRINVLRSMLQGFYKSAMQPTSSSIAQMDELSLIGELKSFLEDKRYMVVFDDVWNPALWNEVKNVFPDDRRGSKIVLTTRQDMVAHTWKASWTQNYIYKMELLSHEKAWELFCKKAFPGTTCPDWLELISHDIVSRCEGLPLALVTLGALLSTKDQDLAVWKRFRDSLSSELEQNQRLSNISRILMLSYKGLPEYLKPCMLYFGMFPENSLIESNRLFKLWTAEDLIKGKRGISIEDVAKDYLLELIQRNLVQVSTRYDCGRIRTIRVHELIHEVLCQKLHELNFCQILMIEDEKHELDEHSRRLSIQKGSLDEVIRSIDSTASKWSIRALFLFEAQELATSPPLLSKALFKKSYLLKVLDLQAAPIEQIPKEVGNLLLLQYLSLRFTKVKSIPKTIGKLINLMTLDLKRCPICELPIEVGNLRKLRHLIAYQNTWHNTFKRWQIGPITVLNRALGRLENLQKLADVNVSTTVGFMDQLGDFKMLKYLAISNVKQENSWTLCKAIEKLAYLESLNVSVDYDSDDPLNLENVTSPPLLLERVYLIGPLDKFPEWIGRLENLKKLRFRGSKLNSIPMNILQSLPNLTMLGINEGVYYGEQLVFQAGGFKKLKAMYFDALINLKSFEIQPGALPLLQDLLIHRSPQLKEVPNGLKFLNNLTSLKMVEMPETFVDSISSNHDIVNHVADIRVGYQTSSGVYIYKKL